jgi:hypothetical protein
VTAWPNPNEYVEVLQNPQSAFADPALRFGTVIADRLGLPRPISGNFAIVFEIIDGMSAPVASERRRWAIRCFARETTGQEGRYAAIARHLARHGLPFMVGFEYLPRGIRVRGDWFPIVKMEWVRGERLDTYVERHLNQPAALLNLAQKWAGVVRALADAHIAHGDLQHGNIVIADGDIRLIDYDGVIVPELAGVPGGEIGHRHYQHPSRTSDRDVNAANVTHVDRFSAWVIWASLIALGIDPTLWNKTGAGDDRLIFTERDYKQRLDSAALGLLLRHSDPRLQEVGRRIAAAMRAPTYLDVPPLDSEGILAPRLPINRDWLQDHGVAPDAPAPNGGRAPDPPPAAQMPDRGAWLDDHADGQRGTRPAPPVIESPLPSSQFVRPARADTPLWGAPTPPTLPEVGDLYGVGGGDIDFDPLWVDAERQRLRALYDELNIIERGVYLFNIPLYFRATVRLQFEKYPLVQAKRRAESAADDARRIMQQAESALQAVMRQHDDARRQVEIERQHLSEQIARLDAALVDLNLDEEESLAAAVANARRAHMDIELRNYPIRANKIPGIGKSRVQALQDAGISTLADIAPHNKISGILALTPVRNADPQTDWSALEAERRRVESMIAFYLPPDAPELLAIRERFGEQRAVLLEGRANAQARLDAVERMASFPDDPAHALGRLSAHVARARTAFDAAGAAFDTAQREVERYAAITPSNLLRKMRV